MIASRIASALILVPPLAVACDKPGGDATPNTPGASSAVVASNAVGTSSNEALLPYQGKFPFDVIGDPKKELYRRFGVESSILSILHPRAWPALFKANVASDKPSGGPEGGPLGLPADFLISSDGKIAARHYGSHAYDQWSVDELLALAK